MYFTWILLLITLLTGLAWFFEKISTFVKGRLHIKRFFFQLNLNDSKEYDAPLKEKVVSGLNERYSAKILEHKRKDSHWWLEGLAGLFPSILLVFFLRSFFLEPFKIPSSSMLPTLHIGDFILVNKFAYGLRLPIIHKKIVHVGLPKRGDIVVFRYPQNESVDYIKRIVGLPGEIVSYKNKELYVNGILIKLHKLKDFYDKERMSYMQQYEEQLADRKYVILKNPDERVFYKPVFPFPFQENCMFDVDSVVCKVPEGHYFVMGDNRDNSADSRYWGFVPERNLIGRAFFVWLNFAKLSRVGKIY